MKREPKPVFTIVDMTEDMIDEATDMRLQSWLDTYPNKELGITREWVEERNNHQRSPERRHARRERFVEGVENGLFRGWAALDSNGKVIGSTTPYIDDEGRQHVGSLYTDIDWHGKGVGGELMKRVTSWFDPKKPIELHVVSYNERAKAFYRKWGFEEITDSETLFDEMIPQIKMVRKPEEE